MVGQNTLRGRQAQVGPPTATTGPCRAVDLRPRRHHHPTPISITGRSRNRSPQPDIALYAMRGDFRPPASPLLSERGLGCGHPGTHSSIAAPSLEISRTEFDLDHPDCSPVPDDFIHVIGGL